MEGGKIWGDGRPVKLGVEWGASEYGGLTEQQLYTKSLFGWD